jgi:Tol biopolymer transport system component
MRAILRLVASLAVLLLAGSCCCGARTGLLLPDMEWLAFDHADAGSSNTDVFISDYGNPPLRRLTTASRGDFYPAFSPDGRRIAYGTERDFPGGPLAIYTMDVMGGGQTPLVRNPALPNDNFLDVRWSPDGRQVAFVQASAIWLFDVGTGAISRLTPPGVLASWPSFGAGGVVAFTRVTGTGTVQVWRIGPGGTPFSRVLGIPDGADQPAWTRDGSAIFFHSGNDVYRLDTGSTTPILVVANASQPAPSPSGTRLAFVRGGDVWKSTIAGASPVRVTSGGTNAHPVWSVPVRQ